MIELADPVRERTRAAADDVLERAARDGERMVCLARLVLASATLVVWGLARSDQLAAGEASDVAVMVMSSLSLLFSIGVLYWLRRARDELKSGALRTLSIAVDATLVIFGLTAFVANPPPGYHGIVRETGLALGYVGILAGGIRLRRRGALFAALLFGVGMLALLVADGVRYPQYVEENVAAYLTAGGLWLTSSVFAWRIASRTRNHVLEGANNAAREIAGLNAQLKARVKERSRELSRALAILASKRKGEGTLAKGTVLGQRFVIDAHIGAGGMGSVYAGIDRESGERVAIKVIQASSASQLDGLYRFLREARAAAAIHHPAVVRMIDVDVSEDGSLFQVQELIDGVTLERALSHRALSAGEAARVGEALASALAAGHAQGFIHRDVKPSNVMLTSVAPGLKLLDFGVVKLTSPSVDDSEGDGVERDDGVVDETNTGSGKLVGTLKYMAPEQLGVAGALTDRTDVYGLGVLLFRALTLQFPSRDAQPALDAACAGAPRLAELVRRCLADRGNERPPCSELVASFASVAHELGAPPLQQTRLSTTKPLHVGVGANAGGDADDADADADAGADASANAGGDSSLLVRAMMAEFPSAVRPPSELLRVSLGRYTLRELLQAGAGRGARGEVWLGSDTQVGDRAVVVRRLARDAHDDDKARFLARARAAARVLHPNLCTIFDVGELDGVCFVVMERVAGEPLRKHLSAGPTVDASAPDAGTAPSVGAIALGIARALEHAHAAGVAHGAVRAENVVLTATGAKLLDLGACPAPGAPMPDAARDILDYGHVLEELLASDGRSPLAAPMRRCRDGDPALGSGKELVRALVQ